MSDYCFHGGWYYRIRSCSNDDGNYRRELFDADAPAPAGYKCFGVIEIYQCRLPSPESGFYIILNYGKRSLMISERYSSREDAERAWRTRVLFPVSPENFDAWESKNDCVGILNYLVDGGHIEPMEE
jgi:hypothetical protein